jgi:hypothetical protein
MTLLSRSPLSLLKWLQLFIERLSSTNLVGAFNGSLASLKPFVASATRSDTTGCTRFTTRRRKDQEPRGREGRSRSPSGGPIRAQDGGDQPRRRKWLGRSPRPVYWRITSGRCARYGSSLLSSSPAIGGSWWSDDPCASSLYRLAGCLADLYSSLQSSALASSALTCQMVAPRPVVPDSCSRARGRGTPPARSRRTNMRPIQCISRQGQCTRQLQSL